MKSKITTLKNTFTQYLNNLQSLREYIEFNKKDEGAHYNQFRPIVYGAIINRAYSSWETFSKELFYEYFLLKKDDYIKNDSFIKRYKIQDLPGYILEELIFDKDKETFNLKISKELLVFTSKNVEIKELHSLYKKIDIDIMKHIDGERELRTFVSDRQLPLANIDTSELNISRALKYIISERNRTAHNAAIDDYLDIDILEEWVLFFEKLGLSIYEKVALFYLEEINLGKKVLIGPCQQVIKDSIGCFDIAKDVYIDKNVPIFIFKGEYPNESLVDVVYVKGFMVEGLVRESVKDFDKAGCEFTSIIFSTPRVKENYKYYIFNNRT